MSKYGINSGNGVIVTFDTKASVRSHYLCSNITDEQFNELDAGEWIPIHTKSNGEVTNYLIRL